MFPPVCFQKLDEDHFKRLSRQQLLQLTADQRAGLREELSDAVDCLLEECPDDDDDDDGNGNGGTDGPISGL